jgi:peptidoglycan LD-endopeptidase LytH
MPSNVSPEHPDQPGATTPGTAVKRPTHLWRVAAVLAAAGVFAGTTMVSALNEGISGAATAESPAERIIVTGEGLLFPIDTVPRCLVFNNFGGFSRAFGAGGHQGVDIGADEGQEVYAVEDGVLYRQFTNLQSAAGYGWGLLSDTDTKYRYYHLAAFADGLVEGDRVVAGQLIGYVGDTGNASPGGWHLHFEVRPGPDPHDQPVDPVPLLDIPRTCTVYPK